ncbi:UDP-N-acetylmuramate--L-alanine ligase [Capilliphycus salinus ALCB114379]|uniref:UDP-N-acetylmuramate--L-alanine ligase n=1 Tax=Capilliphycus salinus TaxID=2768948 RepID=UPI0039A4D50E
MPSSVDFSGRPFHFIGIGGIGMSALAYILAKRNLPIYGSDLQMTHITRRLQNLGVHIFWSQEASNFEAFQTQIDPNSTPNSLNLGQTNGSKPEIRVPSGAVEAKSGNIASSMQLPQVVCSTAIHPENAEYKVARALGCPILHRSDLLAALIEEYQSIAVAGTHGKTTTSSLIAYMMLETGLDPTILVGGEVSAWEGNARVGQSPYLVAEADESDGSLVKFAPAVGIITNIELDHPDHYQNLDQVVSTFETFANHCQTLIGCIDCATVRERIQPQITYSLNPDSGADYTVDAIEYHSDGSVAQVWERGKLLGQLKLKLLGQHNLQNALAAIAVGRHFGLEFAEIAIALASFSGAKRRFEHRGYTNGILFVDDYAHHPSEIRATLAAARQRMTSDSPTLTPVQRIVAIFQPHRYSRTQAFLSEFAQCFGDADLVVLTDIYSAGEPNTGQIDGQQLADAIATYHPQVYYRPTLESVNALLSEILAPRDLALFLGAGNLNKIIPEAIAFYQPSPAISG